VKAALARPSVLAAALLLALAAPGCRRAAGPPAPTVPAVKTYPLTGEIVKVDPARKVLIVRHDAIPGFMSAMTMEFFASGADVAAAKPGQRIRATLLPEAKDGPRLEKIWPADPVAESAIAAAANMLRQETSALGKLTYREVGENIPGFSLYDQEGRVVSAAQFQGKQVLLNFIYTRCPIATMCPAATSAMMAAQAQARAAGVKNLELVSITLEPEYDTPAVLKDYARARGMDTSNFTLLTGPERAIRDLFAQFGISAEIKNGLLNHNLATLLINADGKIILRRDGSQWKPEEFVERMRKG
jgi:protein SCO1/2